MQRTEELKQFKEKLVRNGLLWAKTATTKQLIVAYSEAYLRGLQ